MMHFVCHVRFHPFTFVQTQRKNDYVERREIEERRKWGKRGSILQRQRLASPTAKMVVAQTTRPVQKNRLRDELLGNGSD